MRIFYFVAMFTMLIASGCTSISGHKVVLDPDGGSVASVVDVEGIPIVVQTPTMAIFVLTKSHYNVIVKTVDDKGNVISQRDLGDVIETVLSETPILLGPSEIYTIDPKRPAAGSISYDMDFENQYPKKIKGTVQDVTIEQLRLLVTDLVDKVIKPLGPPKVSPLKGEVVEKRLISSKISLVIVDLVSQRIDIKPLD